MANPVSLNASKDDLDFPFAEKPKWRELQATKTSKLINEIVKFTEAYEELDEGSMEFCNKEFARAMSIDCIHNLNIGEMVGTQDKDTTKAVLESLLLKKNLATKRKWKSLAPLSTGKR